MMNSVNLTGRLTKEPELRYTPEGTAVTTFTLAVNRTWENKQGEREADFIQCVVFRKPAEVVADYVKKGHLIGLEGRIQTRTYEADHGRVWVTEVVADKVHFLEKKEEEPKKKQWSKKK